MTHHVWEADKYNEHSSVQYDSAIDLLRKINIAQKERILDVGCGDGKVTYSIAQNTFANTKIIGIDKSPDMIAFSLPRCIKFI